MSSVPQIIYTTPPVLYKSSINELECVKKTEVDIFKALNFIISAARGAPNINPIYTNTVSSSVILQNWCKILTPSSDNPNDEGMPLYFSENGSPAIKISPHDTSINLADGSTTSYIEDNLIKALYMLNILTASDINFINIEEKLTELNLSTSNGDDVGDAINTILTDNINTDLNNIVYFPCGTYLTSKSIKIPSNTTVIGEDRDNTIIKLIFDSTVTNANTTDNNNKIRNSLMLPVLCNSTYNYTDELGSYVYSYDETTDTETVSVTTDNENTGEGNTNIHISNITVDGNWQRLHELGITRKFSFSNNAGTAVIFSNVHNSSIKCTTIKNGYTHCLDIMSAVSRGDFFLKPVIDPETKETSNNYIINNLYTGASNNILVKDVRAENAYGDDCITTHYSHGLVFDNCTVLGNINRFYKVYITKSDTNTFTKNINTESYSYKINNILVTPYTNAQCGIEIDDGSYDIVVKNCTVRNCSTGINAKSHSYGYPVHDITIENCTASNNCINYRSGYYEAVSSHTFILKENTSTPVYIGDNINNYNIDLYNPIAYNIKFINCKSNTPLYNKSSSTGTNEDGSMKLTPFDCQFFSSAGANEIDNLTIDGLECNGESTHSNYCRYNSAIVLNLGRFDNKLNCNLNNIKINNVFCDNAMPNSTVAYNGLIRLYKWGQQPTNIDPLYKVNYTLSNIYAENCGNCPVIGYTIEPSCKLTINKLSANRSSENTNIVRYLENGEILAYEKTLNNAPVITRWDTSATAVLKNIVYNKNYSKPVP